MKNTRNITNTLLLIGLILIFIGVAKGEPVIILQKATKICLECIGIG